MINATFVGKVYKKSYSVMVPAIFISLFTVYFYNCFTNTKTCCLLRSKKLCSKLLFYIFFKSFAWIVFAELKYSIKASYLWLDSPYGILLVSNSPAV